ncbi:MAG: peptidylprolyl isomerase [Dehalococcoidia bacterium]|nr:peptidylprolyl isomerase [Dehalococcoidia bacterium]
MVHRVRLAAIGVIAAMALVACQPAAPLGSGAGVGAGSCPNGAAAQNTTRRYSNPPQTVIDVNRTYVVTIETTKGNIVVEMPAPNAPRSVNNFVFLACDGFYDGLTFHRVEPWVIQGGDPAGNGTGGPGYRWADEPVLGEYLRGVVAMANAGPNTNGSQFFILKRDTPLPKAYNLFGRVTEGLDVVDRITIGDRMTRVRVAVR